MNKLTGDTAEEKRNFPVDESQPLPRSVLKNKIPFIRVLNKKKRTIP